MVHAWQFRLQLQSSYTDFKIISLSHNEKSKKPGLHIRMNNLDSNKF